MKLLKWLLILCAAGMMVGGGYVCVKGYSLLEQALSSGSLEDRIDELRQKDGYTSLAELPDTYLQAVVAVLPSSRLEIHTAGLLESACAHGEPGAGAGTSGAGRILHGTVCAGRKGGGIK